VTASSEADDQIFADLNSEQLRAVQAASGPVVIVAGAGSGKTTTITRRIAYQVRSGAFDARSMLAVTFTRKAAAELVARLDVLGVPGVQTRTFHSAALRQVERLGRKNVDVLESKTPILLRIRDRLPGELRDRAVGDLATEIERAKSYRLTPETYAAAGNRSGLPPEWMQEVFVEYEREKRASGKLDYEDLLEEAIRLFDNDETLVRRFRDACRAITVDEYQDVNLLQQTLLDRWLGDRDDVCVVGDDYQAIFGFTGASPQYLIAMRDRFPHAQVITLETNYRSTEQILATANRLVPALGGISKKLRPHNGSGPEPTVKRYPSPAAEVEAIVGEVKKLIGSGVAPHEIAILYRINARSTRFELPLHEAGVPYQVAKGGFLDRAAARRMLRHLGRAEQTGTVAGQVEHAAHDAGYLPNIEEDDVGPQEYTRQVDLRLLIDLAREFDDGAKSVSDFVEYLRERFGSYEDAATRSAVRLSTFHSAKGLEWDAVFLPAVADRELPYWRAIREGNVDEERRLFYVGLTRARRYLHFSSSEGQAPSPFLDELAPTPVTPPVRQVAKRGPRWFAPEARAALTASPSVSASPLPVADGDVPALLASLPSPWKRSGGEAGQPRIRNGRSSQPWTDDEDRLVAHFHGRGLDDEAIADQLARRVAAVHGRRAKLGLI
jgi:DNA helicase-2/ATP-dependent DNA helicase PcrA